MPSPSSPGPLATTGENPCSATPAPWSLRFCPSDHPRDRGPPRDAQLGEHVGEVTFDRPLGEEQLSGDLAVRAPERDELGDLELPAAEPAETAAASAPALAGAHALPQPAQVSRGLIAHAMCAARGELRFGPSEKDERRITGPRLAPGSPGEGTRAGRLHGSPHGVRSLRGAFCEPRRVGRISGIDRKQGTRVQHG